MSKTKNSQERLITLCGIAILCAMQVVLARWLVIPISSSLRISFSFIPVVIAARSFGVLSSVAVYGLGDLVGAIAFPTTGAFNPCFTITAALSGLIFGLFLSKKADIMRIIGSVLCSQVFCTLMLNSFWLWKFYYSAEKGYPAVLLSRLPQSIITAVLQILFMAFFLEKIARIIKRLLKR